MDKKTIFIALLLVLQVLACTQRDIPVVERQDGVLVPVEETTELIVTDSIEDVFLHVPTLRALSVPVSHEEEWSATEYPMRYVGYAYWPHSLDGQEPLNLRGRILDVKGLLHDSDLKGSVQNTYTSSTSYFSYAYRGVKEDMTRFYEKTTNELKLSLTVLKLFSIGGHRKTIKETLKTSHNYVSEAYGATRVQYRMNQTSMVMSDVVRARIIERYLYPAFQSDLYVSPIGQSLTSLSPYIVSSYFTGGSLTAYYRMHTMRHVDSTQLAADLIYGVDGGGKIGGDKDKIKDSTGLFTYEEKKQNGSGNKEERDHVLRYVESIGGDPKAWHQQGVEDARLPSPDFSSWAASLSDVSKHALIEIAPHGLIPITQFILEENLQRRILDTYKEILPSLDAEKLPNIRIQKVFVREGLGGSPLCDVVAILNTRNDDYILLSPVRSYLSDEVLAQNDNRAIFIARAEEIVKRLRSQLKFKEKIKASPSKILRPYLRYQLCVSFPFDFGGKDVYLYKNEKNHMCYVYSLSQHLAFSYMDLGGLSEGTPSNAEKSGFAEWIRELPQRPISVLELMRNYRVVAL